MYPEDWNCLDEAAINDKHLRTTLVRCAHDRTGCGTHLQSVQLFGFLTLISPDLLLNCRFMHR